MWVPPSRRSLERDGDYDMPVRRLLRSPFYNQRGGLRPISLKGQMAFTELVPLTLVELLDPEIEATIRRLNKKKFHPDPIAGDTFSRVVKFDEFGL